MVRDRDRLAREVVRDGVQVGEDLAPGCPSRRAGRRSGRPAPGAKATNAASTTPPITAQRRRHGARAELQPAERARAAEDREQRGGQQQVAAEDRQAGGGEHAEGGDRDEPGRDRQRRAAAHERQHEHAARGGAEQAGLAQDLAEPARDRQRHGAEPGLALQHLGVVARAEQRVQRVAGQHQVVRHPDAPARRPRAAAACRSRL